MEAVNLDEMGYPLKNQWMTLRYLHAIPKIEDRLINYLKLLPPIEIFRLQVAFKDIPDHDKLKTILTKSLPALQVPKKTSFDDSSFYTIDGFIRY